MTKLSDKPARRQMWLGALVVTSLGCLSLEPMSSYSDGARTAPEPAAEIESLPPPAVVEALPPAEPAAEVSEGLPGDGAIVLQPVVATEDPAPVEPPAAPRCAGLGEFMNAAGTTCYLRSATDASWMDALATCQAWGGLLVVVDSREEDAFLGAEVAVTFWIGASDLLQEGRMSWNGGAPLAFSNWGLGEPNDFQGREDCVVKAMPSGSWNDLPCGNLNAYVCERSLD